MDYGSASRCDLCHTAKLVRSPARGVSNFPCMGRGAGLERFCTPAATKWYTSAITGKHPQAPGD